MAQLKLNNKVLAIGIALGSGALGYAIGFAAGVTIGLNYAINKVQEILTTWDLNSIWNIISQLK